MFHFQSEWYNKTILGNKKFVFFPSLFFFIHSPGIKWNQAQVDKADNKPEMERRNKSVEMKKEQLLITDLIIIIIMARTPTESTTILGTETEILQQLATRYSFSLHVRIRAFHIVYTYTLIYIYINHC